MRLLTINIGGCQVKLVIFPVFENLFRRNDENASREDQTDQAGGSYFKYFEKNLKQKFIVNII